MKEHKISQADYQKFDLYAYPSDMKHGDVQGVVNIFCETHRNEIEKLHKSYRMLLDNLMHKLARADQRATAAHIAIDIHNQKMMG